MCAMAFKDTRLVPAPNPAGVPSPNVAVTIGNCLAIKEV